ncbi:isochorismatase family protein [Sneathiella sp.]|jgi:nicotinamidase-related amidase|uniref:isochorismatase family protein n=1 Tax=Sneathiella sp. TaxID=1964365 RepID=UPI0039E22CB2
MPLIDPTRSLLLIIDFQERLLPALQGGSEAVSIATTLLKAAQQLSIPVVMTEQNPDKLCGTTSALSPGPSSLLVPKMTFNSCQADGFQTALGNKDHLIVVGAEAHVCVLQTVLGLCELGKSVFVVSDGIASRTSQNKDAALTRMAKSGAEIVTGEMVIFEWLQTAEHPSFKDIHPLIK